MTRRKLPFASAHTGTRTKLLDAAVTLVRQKGFAATSIDDLCRHAGVTKGAFFHHFASKEALGVAAANHWSATTAALFANAAYHEPADPLERVFGYLDFRRDLIAGDVADFTCLAGTMAQEVHESGPAIADACSESIVGHAMTLVPDIEAAFADHGVDGIAPLGMALHFQAVLQGSFILAKATGDAAHSRDGIALLERYVAMLCNVAIPRRSKGNSA